MSIGRETLSGAYNGVSHKAEGPIGSSYSSMYAQMTTRESRVGTGEGVGWGLQERTLSSVRALARLRLSLGRGECSVGRWTRPQQLAWFVLAKMRDGASRTVESDV